MKDALDLNKDSLNIVLGVSGGIAAYKACSVVRLFTEAGHKVRVVPTAAALNFVGAATWEALSGNPVSTSVFEDVDQVQHVRVGQEADVVVIAPATADCIARLAAGRADDLLTATVLVAACPVVVFPAMHTEMWLNPAVQENVATLRRRGMTVVGPASGRLTGKDSGPGRLPDPEQIAPMVLTVAARAANGRGGAMPRDLAGRRVLITAGGTQENVDPVRFIGNRSSGKQGFALAEVASARGAQVTVVAGSTAALPTPVGAEVVRVVSARQMYDQTVAAVEGGDFDVVVCAAAVADFRPAHEAGVKLKKGSAGEQGLRELVLEENPDILAEVVRVRQRLGAPAVVVGFAAETGDPQGSPLEHARAKLSRKGCDFLVCNDVAGGQVFGQDENAGWVLSADGEVSVIAPTSKWGVADQVWDVVAARL